MDRHLIVNADGFGLSAGVNRGIIECAERGILTSASLMVRQPAAIAAAAYAKTHRAVSVGLHVDLGEWVFRKGNWEPLYQVVDLADSRMVAEEINRQLAEFYRLLGRGPSHLDSHQHVHRREPARSILVDLGRKLGLPVRGCCPSVHFCGEFYGQDGEGHARPGVISVANLATILQSRPEGITELGCHPGYGDDLNSPYREERAAEVRVLCDPKARTALTVLGFHLRNFNEPA